MNMIEMTSDNIGIYNGELKKRIENCCCKYCGSELVLRNIVYGENNAL